MVSVRSMLSLPILDCRSVRLFIVCLPLNLPVTNSTSINLEQFSFLDTILVDMDSNGSWRSVWNIEFKDDIQVVDLNGKLQVILFLYAMDKIIFQVK